MAPLAGVGYVVSGGGVAPFASEARIRVRVRVRVSGVIRIGGSG